MGCIGWPSTASHGGGQGGDENDSGGRRGPWPRVGLVGRRRTETHRQTLEKGGRGGDKERRSEARTLEVEEDQGLLLALLRDTKATLSKLIHRVSQ
jgi:hypothetical protein